MSDPESLEEHRKNLERWRKETLQPALDQFQERKKEFLATSSQSVERLYTSWDWKGKIYQEELGFPGEYPYTRGIHATRYQGRLWTKRMFAYRHQREINQDKRKIVGVNIHEGEEKELEIPLLEMDPEGYQRQVNRLETQQEQRDSARGWAIPGSFANCLPGNGKHDAPYIGGSSFLCHPGGDH